MKTTNNLFKKLLWLFLAVVFLLDVLQAQELDWAKTIGDFNPDNNILYSSKPYDYEEYNGNTYLAYAFSDSILIGSTTYIPSGTNDVIIIKFKNNGDVDWVTQYGGNGTDGAVQMKINENGNVFFTGVTNSTNLVTTSNAYMSSLLGVYNIYVGVLDTNGSIIYSSYLGGTESDWIADIDVMDSNKCFLVGYTASDDFPIIGGAFQATFADTGVSGTEMFITKLNITDGTLEYSTFIGGLAALEWPYAMTLDVSGNAYITGVIIDAEGRFPTTLGAYDISPNDTNGGAPCCNGDVFVTKVNSDGTDLVYSTYIGGYYADFGNDIILNSSNEAIVVGWTSSFQHTFYIGGEFPITANAYQSPKLGDGSFGFISKLSENGDQLLYSSALGGTSPKGGALACNSVLSTIALLSDNEVIVGGKTTCNDHPVTIDALIYNNPGNGFNEQDGFISILNMNNNTLRYSSYLGTNNDDRVDNVIFKDDYIHIAMGYRGAMQLGTTTLNSTNDGDIALIKLNDGCDMVNDCVWPGDADDDGEVNIHDILPIGLAFNDSGSIREFIDDDWVAHKAGAWDSVFAYGVNHKHADCYGDGKVDVSDLSAIVNNFTLTHSKTKEVSNIEAITHISLIFNPANIAFNTPLTMSVLLGTESQPATNFYGIAFTIDFGYEIDSLSLTSNFASSWMGTIGTNMEALIIPEYTNGRLHIGIVRTDRQNISGFGEIAELGFVLIENVAGKIGSEQNSFAFTVSNIKAIDNNENILDVEGETYYSSVKDRINSNYDIFISPNPNTGNFSITSSELIEKIELFSMDGKLIYNFVANGTPIRSYHLSDINSKGNKVLKLTTEQGIYSQMILVQ